MAAFSKSTHAKERKVYFFKKNKEVANRVFVIKLLKEK